MRPVAYLVSEYHAASHTFIRREVEALRAAGEHIVPFSIRGSREAEGKEPIRPVMGRSPVFYVAALLAELFRNPLRLASIWLLAVRHRVPGMRSLIWAQFHFIEAVALVSMLRPISARRVHSHFANSGATVGMLAARLAGIPWSLTLHGISELDYPAGVLLPAKLRAADKIAVANRFMLAQAMRVTEPKVWSRFHVVHCGIGFEAVPERRPAKFQDGPARIVCVGRMSPEKGHMVLLAALERLREQGLGVRVDLVGDGPARMQVEAAFARAGFGDQAHFHGALNEEETLQRIADADLLVLPSLMEGLPVVLMEAMAIGVPVIASRVAGIPELVEHEATGLCFTPTDSEELSCAIARLVRDPELAQRLAIAGQEVVRREFDIAQSARQMAILFASGA